MASIRTAYRFVSSIAAAAIALAVPVAFAQKGNGPPSSAGSSSAGSPTGRNPTATNGNSFPLPSSTGSTNGLARPIFLSGSVLFDDGTPPNPNINIQRMCGASIRLEAHTDRTGHFSFQMGQDREVDTDAEDTNAGLGIPGTGRSASRTGATGQFAGSSTPLANCELRASYPGYRSDLIDLSSRHTLDDPNVGTIILHRLASVHGTTLSITTAMAPKGAQKEYEKGQQLMAKDRFEEAEKHLARATEIYPKYAIAWCALGDVQHRLGKIEDARASYATSIAADSRYVNPYAQLALLSAQANKWQEAADYTQRVIQLNPVEFASAFWLNAVANYKLHKVSDAERSVRRVLEIDSQHQYIEAESLLGEILFERREYVEAAQHLRAYLALNPDPQRAQAAREALQKLEQASAEAKK